MRIEDYESGEQIQLRNLNFTDNFANEATVNYNSASGYTVISKELDDGLGDTGLSLSLL